MSLDAIDRCASVAAPVRACALGGRWWTGMRALTSHGELKRVCPFWYAALREMQAEGLITADDYEALILMVLV